MQYCSLQGQTCSESTKSNCSYYLLQQILSQWHINHHHQTYHNWMSFCFGLALSFSLELFLPSSPVAYWTATNLEGSSSAIISCCFSYCSWGSRSKNTEVVCHSILQWITFCQNSWPWPGCPGWPKVAWLIVSLSCTRLWSMWSLWLALCKLPDGRSWLWGIHLLLLYWLC